MKILSLLTSAGFALLLVACSGDDPEQSPLASTQNSASASSRVVGYVEFEGERYELNRSDCARTGEGASRWFADSEDVVIRLRGGNRPQAGDERYSMEFTRRGIDAWEVYDRHTQHQTVTITDDRVSGTAMIFPRNSTSAERESGGTSIKFEFRCS